MKKISALILAAALACSSAPAQKNAIATDSAKNVAVSQVVKTSVTDTLAVTEPETDVDCLVDGEPTTVPSISVKDGKWAVAYDGSEYIISKLIADSESARIFRELDDLDAPAPILKDSMGMATAIIAIVFGAPCLTIIVGLIVILIFALKRNRGRNELINNAIDRNYQLPDSFYVGQKNNNGAVSSTRDSRKFYSATTFIAIGLSLVIFALYADASFFLLVGGIPMFIGIGQLIGYYCVPASPGRNPMPPYGGGQPFYHPYGNPASWNPAPDQNPAPQQTPYGPAQSAPFSSPQTPVPSDDSTSRQTPPEYTSEPNDRQTPPPYNPS